MNDKITAAIIVIIVIVVGAGLYYSFSGGAEEGPKVETVKIGNIHPLTGPLAFEGVRFRDACKLAVEEVNEAGGIESLGGAKVELLTGDCAYDTEKASSEAERLIRNGCVALTGCYASPLTYAASRVAEREKTPFVVSVAVSSEIVKGRGFEYVYRIQPHAEKMAAQWAKWVPKMVKGATGEDLQSVGIVWVNNEFGKSISSNLKKDLKAKGVEIAVDISYSADVVDFKTEVSKLKQADPEIVIPIGYYRDGVLLFKTMNEQGYTPPGVIGCADGALGVPKFVDEMGEKVNYLMGVNYQFNYKKESTQEILQKYQNQYGRRMSTSSGHGYLATKVIIKAIEKAGSTDTEEIEKALEEIRIEDVPLYAYDYIEFDDEGENPGSVAAMMQFQNLEKKIVYPERYRMAEVVYPVPE